MGRSREPGDGQEPRRPCEPVKAGRAEVGGPRGARPARGLTGEGRRDTGHQPESQLQSRQPVSPAASAAKQAPSVRSGDPMPTQPRHLTHGHCIVPSV